MLGSANLLAPSGPERGPWSANQVGAGSARATVTRPRGGKPISGIAARAEENQVEAHSSGKPTLRNPSAHMLVISGVTDIPG